MLQSHVWEQKSRRHRVPQRPRHLTMVGGANRRTTAYYPLCVDARHASGRARSVNGRGRELPGRANDREYEALRRVLAALRQIPPHARAGSPPFDWQEIRQLQEGICSAET